MTEPNNTSILKIGIDIGSTTVKVIVLDKTDNILFRAYERHFSNVREKTGELLNRASDILDGKNVRMLITGSAGLGVAKSANLPFIQEVFATAKAVKTYIPNADSVIELGGEDAKIIFFKGSLEERMNGSCAGGTGAFIDQMATLLNVTVEELDELSQHFEKIYPIASRCGVFAKTDIQPILNQGGQKEDVAASIYQAVVDQTIAGLTQGRSLGETIVFLGGPLYYYKGLRKRFAETLSLDEDHAVFPKNGDCFAALGAALSTEGYEYIAFSDILKKIGESVDDATHTNTMPPLFTSREEYEAFCKRHNSNAPPNTDIAAYSGDAWLGVDAGSTTTKLVLIDENCGILYSYYGSNQGNPVGIVLAELKKIYELAGDRIRVKGSAVTGYGEDLIKNAFNMDLGLVETIAHYRAAKHFNPDVDFIIDIGGQDMKCFKIRNGAVDSIFLNEACSSGCGSFIETFARALGYEIEEFSRLGLFVEHPVNLGSRCTVFMNSSVKQAQRDGATVADISAGLSISIVKNAVYKVIRAANADDLGKHIVVQGGTFKNDAVLRSFEQELERQVTRPVIAGISGAYGAALYAKDTAPEEPGLLTRNQLTEFTHKARPITCNICTNHCSLTINTFDNGRRFVSGNRCTRPLGKQKTDLPNLAKWKYDRLRSLTGVPGPRGKIGIPFGLNMFENLPFWHAFFTKLGFEIVLSPESSRAVYRLGQHTIPSDTVCYPAKLMHGHVISLINEGIDTIFYPCMPYNFDEGAGDNNFNCPVVAYYPELLAANISELTGVRFMDPYFGLHRPKDFAKRAAVYFKKEFGIPNRETKAAVSAAYEAYETYKADIHAKGEEYIRYARENGHKILVMAGRPYHIDPEIGHGIDELAVSYGFVLISEDSVSHLVEKERRKVLNQWTYQSRLYSAARYICTQPDMELIQLVSFGCGIDAITTDETRDILETGGKLYTQIKIDEITNLGAVKIRLRSLIAAVEARERV
ncbi:MAG: acyl-CoA dehydratase activase [Methanocorpusculum sp.]|uniref:acyl-CoA dehydratase activase-related protein n=1 Tax=Methanocorpusculum sp. TaxID=2058474 RepID=UPI002726FF58|nr:acyl-CoA dehydratase activase-related protein [Methanocorpusculum sp.]MDO9523403.1 acyl-CoA dehydratase activase [Methanocorpusculum sp.]